MLSLTPERFEQIRHIIMEREAAEQTRQVLHESGPVAVRQFATVDDFLAYLDSLSA